MVLVKDKELKPISKREFTRRFWSMVDKEIKEQQLTYFWLSEVTGIKRTTLTSAKLENREIFFSTAILILRALNIPTYKFTMKLAKRVKVGE